MSKAKAIGTRAETAVRNYLLSAGYGELEARRNVLSGSEDEGDIWLEDSKHGLIVFEIKGGKMAKAASLEQCEKWMIETERERVNAKANFGFLVTQRSGVGYPRAGRWYAYAKLGDLFAIRFGGCHDESSIVRVNLDDLVRFIRG